MRLDADRMKKGTLGKCKCYTAGRCGLQQGPGLRVSFQEGKCK